MINTAAADYAISFDRSAISVPSFRDTVRDDVADLQALADAVLAGRLTDARALADSFDTIVRESIPNEAWQYLHRPEVR